MSFLYTFKFTGVSKTIYFPARNWLHIVSQHEITWKITTNFSTCTESKKVKGLGCLYITSHNFTHHLSYYNRLLFCSPLKHWFSSSLYLCVSPFFTLSTHIHDKNMYIKFKLLTVNNQHDSFAYTWWNSILNHIEEQINWWIKVQEVSCEPEQCINMHPCAVDWLEICSIQIHCNL